MFPIHSPAVRLMITAQQMVDKWVWFLAAWLSSVGFWKPHSQSPGLFCSKDMSAWAQGHDREYAMKYRLC